MSNDNEYFTLKSIKYTKNPLASLFLLLIGQESIKMGHLIKRINMTRGASEKGPLFKIKPQHMEQLFLESQEFYLAGE